VPDEPIYTVRAYWPDAIREPAEGRFARLADAVNWALALMRGHEHTTISVLVTDASMELVRLWGQPMPDGKDWP
jgi:hypothetical protein